MSKKRKKKNGRKERIIGNNSKYIGTYTITEEPLEDKHTKRIPKEIRKRAEELHDMLLHKPKKVIPLLLGYIKKYPNLPLLYNYLSAAYGRIGDLEKVESTVVENLNKHPDYLFAKLNYADICLRKGKASKGVKSTLDSYIRQLSVPQHVFSVVDSWISLLSFFLQHC